MKVGALTVIVPLTIFSLKIFWRECRNEGIGYAFFLCKNLVFSTEKTFSGCISPLAILLGSNHFFLFVEIITYLFLHLLSPCIPIAD